ncbi:MAG TPA: hypothetical protein VK832_09075 [Burkholderiaceae bacterium]|nr:hypothetical protein [Burkholderiaceae bacterium]
MEFLIAIAYVVLIVATLMVRRALKMREHQNMRQFSVRSSTNAAREHHH